MRGSLRALALERLGHIDYALLGERFFRDEIAKEISGTTAPVILLNGSARHATSQARASRVQIQGIDQRFTDLFPSGGESLLSSLQQANDTPFPSLVISASLQRELGAKIGDAILLSLQRQSQSHQSWNPLKEKPAGQKASFHGRQPGASLRSHGGWHVPHRY